MASFSCPLSEEFRTDNPDSILEVMIEDILEGDIDHDLVKSFLKKFPKYINPNSTHNNLLFVACCSKDIALVKLLIEFGFDFSLIKQDILHRFCEGKEDDERSKMLLFLIELGADVNSQDEDGNTPLIVALGEGNEKFATILICNNVNLDNLNLLDEEEAERSLLKKVLKSLETDVKEPECD